MAGLLFTSRRTSLADDHLDDMIFVRSFNRYLRQKDQPLPEMDDSDAESSADSQEDIDRGEYAQERNSDSNSSSDFD